MDVKVSKSISTKKKDGFNGLHLKAFGLHNINGLTIELHDTLTSGAVSNSNGSFLKQGLDNFRKSLMYLYFNAYLTTEGLDGMLSFSRHEALHTIILKTRIKMTAVGIILDMG